MKINYWSRDTSRQEIITKTKIHKNFNLYASYYNLMDAKTLSFNIDEANEIAVDKLYSKNGFEFIVLEIDKKKELLILPNENLFEYTKSVVSKIDKCNNEADVLDLLINEMNLKN